jgi:hypothetical protein
MPGARFRKNLVGAFFNNGGTWGQSLSRPVPPNPNIPNFKYIGPEMVARIKTVINAPGNPDPTVQSLLRFILTRTRQLAQNNPAAFAGQDRRYKALETVLGMLVWNTNHMTCDPKTKYLRRAPNRFAFNILAELVAYAKLPANRTGLHLTQAQAGYLNSFNRLTIKRDVICRFNEGVDAAEPLETGVNAQGIPLPYLCKQTVSNTAGGTPFANALSTCPCHNQDDCGQDARCAWRGGNIQKCYPSAASVAGAGRRRGSKYRSTDGRIRTAFSKISALETHQQPPGVPWTAPVGVRFTQGGRQYWVP